MSRVLVLLVSVVIMASCAACGCHNGMHFSMQGESVIGVGVGQR